LFYYVSNEVLLDVDIDDDSEKVISVYYSKMILL